MTLDSDRTTIANALDGVADVTGYEQRPAVLRTGDAWPTLSRVDLEHGLVWRPTWLVNVVLPADDRAAQEWVDHHLDPLVGALRNACVFPAPAELVPVDTPEGRFLILEITVRSH